MIGWLDMYSGVSGDMLLGALVDAGVPLDVLSSWVIDMGLPIELTAERVNRAGLSATKVHVHTQAQAEPRSWLDIRELFRRGAADLPLAAERTFQTLATAEARVHGIAVEDVHFHEVGALDAIADVVGVCAGFRSLGLRELTGSAVALGGGTASTAHGSIPIPGPAVLEIARTSQLPAYGGGDHELCTPTGAALVANLVTAYGPMPPMVIQATGTGAGSRDLPERPNVVRLVLGEPISPDPAPSPVLVLSANVDDLDPRAWPSVLQALLTAGADDAWLIPILMKKGRPAHTVNALVTAELAAAVRQVMFRETTTLGIRDTPAAKTALAREFRSVEVDGERIVVKVAVAADGQVLNAMPEWDDVQRAADVLGRPITRVLAQALAAFELAG